MPGARSAAQTRALQEEFAEWLALDPRDRKRLRLPATREAWAEGKGISERTLRNWQKLPHVEAILATRLSERAPAERPAPAAAAVVADADASELSLVEQDYEVARRVLMQKVEEATDPRWATLWFRTYGQRLADAETSATDIDLSEKSDADLAAMLPAAALAAALRTHGWDVFEPRTDD